MLPRNPSHTESIALAKELIEDRVNSLLQLPKEDRETATVTLIMALAHSLSAMGTVFLKDTKEQPEAFGIRIGNYITETMTHNREESLTNATAKADDPWE